MIQITPQMKILVAIEPADFRKGIDGLARLCKERFEQDPQSGCVFVFRNRRATALKVLCYDGQGYWLCYKRLSNGRFHWWPTRSTGASKKTGTTKKTGAAKALAAHQLQVLFSAGNPDRTAAAPDWRPVGPKG